MNTGNESWGHRMLRVMDYVHAHLDEEDLSPARLAELSGFSLHHFHRVFRGMAGESVMGFIRRLRLERAAHHLKFSTTPVTDVAFSSGYQSHEAFTRAFRRRFGVAPSAYRAREHATGGYKVDARMEDLPSRKVVAVRFVGPYESCGTAWESMYARLGPNVARVQNAFGLVYDDPDITELNRLRYDACVELRGELAPLAAGAEVRTIPAGRYAISRHVGPYESILESYVALLGGWLPHRGVELHDEPIVEHYLNDPRSTPAHDLETDICVRIV